MPSNDQSTVEGPQLPVVNGARELEKPRSCSYECDNTAAYLVNADFDDVAGSFFVCEKCSREKALWIEENDHLEKEIPPEDDPT